jgi:hypothetical protein
VIPLRANQRVILSDVPVYELENPPRRGDRLLTTSGIATVTHIDQAGNEQVFWADYGSGIPQPHVSEGILSVSPSPSESSPPEQKLARLRRHTPKGKACGWIEERVGNKNRGKPSISFYYKWDDAEGRGSRYVPAGKVERVREMVYGESRSVADVLGFLNG